MISHVLATFFKEKKTTCVQGKENFIKIIKYSLYGQIKNNSDYISQTGSHGTLISNNEREITGTR